jgi:hypothetical protein
MGVSDPEIQKKVFGPRWQHEIEKQSWPLWKRLIHRFHRFSMSRIYLTTNMFRKL